MNRGSRLVRDQRPTFGSLLPAACVLEQLKSGKQNSNCDLHAPPEKEKASAQTPMRIAHTSKQAVPVTFVHLPVFRRVDGHHLRTAKCLHKEQQLGLDRNSCLPPTRLSRRARRRQMPPGPDLSSPLDGEGSRIDPCGWRV